jgi:hypothetical protein
MLTLYQTARLYAYRSAWMADDNPKEAGLLTPTLQKPERFRAKAPRVPP